GLDDDLELSARHPPHPARRARAERDHQHLAMDAERVGDLEDRVDLLHGHHLQPALAHAFTLTTRPPAMVTRSAEARRTSASGVPRAAEIGSWWSRSSSMKVSMGLAWPGGGMPPTA